jgi:hypothetical protein
LEGFFGFSKESFLLKKKIIKKINKVKKINSIDEIIFSTGFEPREVSYYKKNEGAWYSKISSNKTTHN